MKTYCPPTQLDDGPRPTETPPSSDAADLLRLAAPMPTHTYRRRAGLPRKGESVGLWWPRLTRSAWASRCRQQPEFAWALGTVLDNFRETPVSDFVPSTKLTDRSLMGSLGGRELRLSSDGGRTLGVMVEGHGLITPGPTIEEVGVDDVGLKDAFYAEALHVGYWLRADEPLALRLLLGPLPRRLYDKQTQRRRLTGYLDDNLCLTRAGWWRLSYDAGRAIGVADRRRQVMLRRMATVDTAADPHGLRHKHLRATQAIALKLYQEEDFIPLGIEMSALADAIGRMYRIRADALLADAIRLVWVEVLRRRERHLPLARQQDYARKRDLMAEIGQVFNTDVEWRLYAPDTFECWEAPLYPPRLEDVEVFARSAQEPRT